jgi:hypothetical protein
MTHPASSPMDIRFFLLQINRLERETDHLHLVPRLITRGAIQYIAKVSIA